jgi:hypothetical protein
MYTITTGITEVSKPIAIDSARTSNGATLRYSAMPPQTPAIILFFRERYIFLSILNTSPHIISFDNKYDNKNFFLHKIRKSSLIFKRTFEDLKPQGVAPHPISFFFKKKGFQRDDCPFGQGFGG